MAQKTKQQELQEIFNIFDEDKDGKIAMSELKDMLYVLCNMEDDKKAQELIKKFDGDENGTIEIHEFEALFNEFPIKPDGKNLIALFNEVDDDHNGYITKEELKKFLVLMKMPVSDSAVEKIMCESDANKDDQVNLREFCQMFRKYAEKSQK